MEFGMRHLQSRYVLPENNRLTHVIVFGRTRTGKSQTLKSLAERAFIKGCKIIDIYSSGVGEGFYWSLPSNHPFWKGRELNGKHNRKMRARDFPVRCLVPISNEIPSDLPDICQPFAIPISKLTESDLRALVGKKLTHNQLALWRRLQKVIKPSTTMEELLYLIKQTKKSTDENMAIHALGITALHNILEPFKKHKLLSSSSNPLRLNLEKEINQKSVVTSLILKYTPPDMWGFIVNHFISQIYDYLRRNKGKIKHKVIIVFRELGDFLTEGEKSAHDEAIKDTLISVMRMGLKNNLLFWGDNQTALNINVIKKEFATKICHKVSDVNSLESALGDEGILYMTKRDYEELSRFPPGRCFILEDRGLFNPQMLPPLSRMTAVEGENFSDVWRHEKGDRFKDMDKELEPIHLEYSVAKLKIEEKIEYEKKKSREKKMLEKMEKEKEKKRKIEIDKISKIVNQEEDIIIEPKKEVINSTKEEEIIDVGPLTMGVVEEDIPVIEGSYQEDVMIIEDEKIEEKESILEDIQLI